MKSNIKRWGIGVFVVAIICLLASFCLLTALGDKNSILADSTINDEQKANVQDNIPAISETIELNGADLAAQSAKWSTAVTSALTGKHILVKLINNWTANADGFVTADVTGFSNKIIHVPTGATITLDLNGKTINRNLFYFKDNGGIFLVNGTLIIQDSTYDHETLVDNYNKGNYQGRYDFFSVACGKIQGGRNYTNGGAIKVTNGTFIMEGGMILDNRANASGGAIHASDSNVVINKGVIYNNTVEGRDGLAGGGAICVSGESQKLDIYNVIMNNNSATRMGSDDGGAIVVWHGECNIYDGIFSCNQAMDAGGVLVSRNGAINIQGGKYEYNYANCGGGFYFAGGTLNVSITNAYIANNSSKRYNGAIFCSLSEAQPTPLYISDTIIKDNVSAGTFGGIGHFHNLTLGKNVQIYDNYGEGKPADVCLAITRIKCSEDLGNSKIGINIYHNYNGGDVVASDYTTFNSKEPYNYFFSNQYASIATTKGNDVVFDKTISGGSYDFVYLDGGKRVNYKDTDYIHTTNDFELRKNVNGGQMVLGSISCGTSVNSFLQNLNFAGNRIKLYNNQNNVIYDYSNSQTGYNHLYDDGTNLAIGTGWHLEVYSQTNSIVEKVYISVLGDVTGDGKINAADVNYLRRIISNNMFDSFADKPYIQLATLIVNKNGLINTDSDILWQVVCNKIDIKSFF